jgi:hypothetical protein
MVVETAGEPGYRSGMGWLRNRRRRRGAALMQPLLDSWLEAQAGWAAVSERTREIYLEYVGQPWLTSTRRLLAHDTATWAALGELEAHIRKPRLRDGPPPLQGGIGVGG